MVKDVLERCGISVDFTSVGNAHKHSLIMASITSSFDIYNLMPHLQALSKRKNKVIVGGFGCQNIYPYRDYVDYAVFGRCENFITPAVKAWLKGDNYKHESVMSLSDGIFPVTIGQADLLYPHTLQTYPRPYTEKGLGCPRKCLFCHYSFARRYIRHGKNLYEASMDYGSVYREVTFDRLIQDSNMVQRVRTALDGFSERLRNAFNKRYSNETITNTLNRLSVEWKSKQAWVMVYMIGSYPTETTVDYRDLRRALNAVTPKGKNVILTLHVTPFRPCPATPAGYMSASIDTNWNQKGGEKYREGELLEASFSPYMESPYNHLQVLIAERATECTDKLIETICYSKNLKKLSASQKIKAITGKFDLSQYTRMYDVAERLPTWYLNTYIPQYLIKKMALKLKKNLGIKWSQRECDMWEMYAGRKAEHHGQTT